DALALAREVGAALRGTVAEQMDHLRARAAFRAQARGSVDRTMAGLAGNPMKTAHHPAAALEALFLRPRAASASGADAMAEAAADLRRHHAALIAALQPALADLVLDLAPERLEADAGGGTFGSGRRRRAWELFVQRWDDKVGPHENGMLDAFFVRLAEAYGRASRQGGTDPATTEETP
ncbi:type VI secretion system-associated FHA domain protein, partial [Jannaschia sp. LMIT008]|uniref:type VI secretion system-associated FHA domain protein n=1 Tax=Jannaschia maritima TaxID=3032585 RepID=UPI002811293D